jgi:glyoxylase-like metal-dependent hydrolase (beta-lactamase superfamily II)
MKVHFLQSGYIKTWRHLLVRRAPEGERFTVPIPFYLIEHEKGLVLFDTGQQPPAELLPPDAPFITEMTNEDRAVEQLKKRGFSPQNITHIILSHRHSDHVDGLQDLPDVECFIQRAETDAPGGAEFLRCHAAKKWNLPDGEYDLFNDGKIILLPTYGHTPGHQSLLLTLDDGSKLLLAADAAYTETALQQSPITEDEKCDPYWHSIARLQKFRQQGIRVIPGHEPQNWQNLLTEFQ